MSPGALAFWQRLFAKLSERSSVCSYLTLIATVFANRFHGDVGTIASLISGAATVLLFLLSDAQVRYWLTGQKPQPPAPTVPQPFDSDKPDKG